MRHGRRRTVVGLAACLLLHQLEGAPASFDDEMSLLQLDKEKDKDAQAAKMGLSAEALAEAAKRSGRATPGPAETRERSADHHWGAGDPLSIMMKFLTGLFTAVRDENFMGSFNTMITSSKKTIADFKEQSLVVATDFDAAVRKAATEAELIELTAVFFNSEAHLMTKYYTNRHMIHRRHTAKMPKSVEEVMTPMLNTLSSQENVDASASIHLDTHASKKEFCAEVDMLMANLTEMDKGMVLAEKKINGTQQMIPMVRSYLNTIRPEVVPRVMWVLTNLLNMEYTGAIGLKICTGAMLEKLTPVLTDRLRCHLEESRSRPQHIAGLFAALVLLVSGLLSL